MPFYPTQGEGEYAFGHIYKEAISLEKPVTITLRDGDQLTGILRREDKYTVTLDTGTQLRVIFKNNVARVRIKQRQDEDI